MTTTAIAACLCGAVRCELTLPSKWVAHCHCSYCRRAHGAAFVTWISVPSDAFRVLSGEADLAHYQSSPAAQRSFCRHCGTPMLFEGERWPGEIHVARACIAGDVDRSPHLHAFYSDRVPWIELHDDLPKYGGVTGSELLGIKTH